MSLDLCTHIRILDHMIPSLLIEVVQPQRFQTRFGSFQNMFQHAIMLRLYIQEIYWMLCFLQSFLELFDVCYSTHRYDFVDIDSAI